MLHIIAQISKLYKCDESSIKMHKKKQLLHVCVSTRHTRENVTKAEAKSQGCG